MGFRFSGFAGVKDVRVQSSRISGRVWGFEGSWDCWGSLNPKPLNPQTLNLRWKV